MNTNHRWEEGEPDMSVPSESTPELTPPPQEVPEVEPGLAENIDYHEERGTPPWEMPNMPDTSDDAEDEQPPTKPTLH